MHKLFHTDNYFFFIFRLFQKQCRNKTDAIKELIVYLSRVVLTFSKLIILSKNMSDQLFCNKPVKLYLIVLKICTQSYGRKKI